MYPSKQKPYAGIFVKNQYLQIAADVTDGDAVDIFYMEREFTSIVGSIWKYLKSLFRFLPFLFRKYDIIHLHFFYPLIYFVWAYKKIHSSTRVVVTFHGKDITVAVNDKNKLHLREISKVIDYTIPVGETLAKIMVDKLNLPVGCILPVGVNDRVFYKEQGVVKIFDYIFIGSFIQRKGIDTVIKAINKLDGTNLKFCFCGSGNYLEELQELQKKYDIVIKQNQSQNELRTLINQSKFFLLMSRNEGFPTATVEALYCGVPIITSDIPQFKEQVSVGVNGFMVPEGDVVGLTKMLTDLRRIDEETYDALQKGALASFKQISLKSVCEKLIMIYTKLASS